MSASTNNTEITKIAETVESLRYEIARLGERTASLERAFAGRAPESVRQTSAAPASAEITEEIILAISAAIAAYLGVKPRTRQIVLLQSHPWSQQGRVTIQASRDLAIHHG